jgi:hypothetical protein
MMNDTAKREIYSLEESIIKVVDQSRLVSSLTDAEPEMLEHLRQIAVALHFTMQALRQRLELPNIRRTEQKECTSDIQESTGPFSRAKSRAHKSKKH